MQATHAADSMMAKRTGATAHALRTALRMRGVTQSALASLVGVSQTNVSRMCGGKLPIPLDLAPRLETALSAQGLCEQLRPDVEWVRKSEKVVACLVPVGELRALLAASARRGRQRVASPAQGGPVATP